MSRQRTTASTHPSMLLAQTGWRIPIAATVALACLLFVVTPAIAAITPTSNANTVAGALTDSLPGGALTGSSFTSIPPNNFPHATADSLLGGFPRSSTTYAILTSGDAALADDANTSGGSGLDDGGLGTPGRTSVRDLSTLRLALSVPLGANCLSVDFRFYSEEAPDPGSTVNDGFLAELDTSDFTANTGNEITAPNNFAFTPEGKIVSVSTAGLIAAEAAGTTYDVATPLLRAVTPITAGAHSIYLSIFDQGDAIYDSAAFLDHMVLTTEPVGGCVAGAARSWRSRRPPPRRSMWVQGR